jgi:hypothetical protein
MISVIRLIHGQILSILSYKRFSSFQKVLGLSKKVQASSSGLRKEFGYFTTPSLPFYNRLSQVKYTSDFTILISLALEGRGLR